MAGGPGRCCSRSRPARAQSGSAALTGGGADLPILALVVSVAGARHILQLDLALAAQQGTGGSLATADQVCAGGKVGAAAVSLGRGWRTGGAPRARAARARSPRPARAQHRARNAPGKHRAKQGGGGRQGVFGELSPCRCGLHGAGAAPQLAPQRISPSVVGRGPTAELAAARAARPRRAASTRARDMARGDQQGLVGEGGMG